jgi:cysteine synthase A
VKDRIARRIIERAEERARKDSSIYLPRQFENPDNPAAHRETTGQEIIEQLDRRWMPL